MIWDALATERLAGDNLMDHPDVLEAVAQALLLYSSNKDCVELGAGRGTLGPLLNAKSIKCVDPYPPAGNPNEVVPLDGVAYLQSLPEESLDFVTAMCAVHWMDEQALDAELRRVLRRPNGRALWVCGADDQLLEFSGLTPEFTDIFMQHSERNRGVKQHATLLLTFKAHRPTTRHELCRALRRRIWGNLWPLTESQMDNLCSLVPDDLRSIAIHFQVYEHHHALSLGTSESLVAGEEMAEMPEMAEMVEMAEMAEISK